MVRAPTLKHVVARAPTFRAVSIQKVIVLVGEMASAQPLSGFGGSEDPLVVVHRRKYSTHILV